MKNIFLFISIFTFSFVSFAQSPVVVNGWLNENQSEILAITSSEIRGKADQVTFQDQSINVGSENHLTTLLWKDINSISKSAANQQNYIFISSSDTKKFISFTFKSKSLADQFFEKIKEQASLNGAVFSEQEL